MEKYPLEALSHIIGNPGCIPAIYDFAIRVLNPGYEYMEHSYPEYMEVVCILEGASFIGVNGHYMKAKRGECIVIFPGVVHNIYLNKKESCKVIDFVFKPEEAEISPDASHKQSQLKFFQELEMKKLDYIRFFDSMALKHLLEGMHFYFKKDDECSRALLFLDFYKMYLIFSKILEENGRLLENSRDLHVKKAQQYIAENHCSQMRLDAVSKAAGVSARHLSRLFCNEFGMNVQEYITIIRMGKARELLENSDMNITEIAYSLGFSSSDYFSSFFKRYEGLSPKDYRKRVLGF